MGLCSECERLFMSPSVVGGFSCEIPSSGITDFTEHTALLKYRWIKEYENSDNPYLDSYLKDFNKDINEQVDIIVNKAKALDGKILDRTIVRRTLTDPNITPEATFILSHQKEISACFAYRGYIYANPLELNRDNDCLFFISKYQSKEVEIPVIRPKKISLFIKEFIKSFRRN